MRATSALTLEGQALVATAASWSPQYTKCSRGLVRGVEVRGVKRRMLPMACEIYEGRPQTCRDFTLGGEHCLTARRRVGLSL